MTNAVDERITTAIRVDHSTLNGQPAGSDTRYTVALSGPVDERWVEACRAVQAESTAYSPVRPAGDLGWTAALALQAKRSLMDGIPLREALDPDFVLPAVARGVFVSEGPGSPRDELLQRDPARILQPLGVIGRHAEDLVSDL